MHFYAYFKVYNRFEKNFNGLLLHVSIQCSLGGGYNFIIHNIIEKVGYCSQNG